MDPLELQLNIVASNRSLLIMFVIMTVGIVALRRLTERPAQRCS